MWMDRRCCESTANVWVSLTGGSASQELMTSSISLDVIVIIISDVTSISVFIVRARDLVAAAAADDDDDDDDDCV